MPIKHGLSALFRFTTNHKYCQREMTETGNEMKGYIIRPMPASLYLDEFFPSKHTLWNSQKVIWPKEGHFSKVVSCTHETEAYNPFISLFYYDYAMFSNLLQITVVKQFAPTFEFINSSTHIDSSGQSEFSFDIKPDICVYTTTSKCQGLTDIAHTELLIELKVVQLRWSILSSNYGWWQWMNFPSQQKSLCQYYWTNYILCCSPAGLPILYTYLLSPYH